MIEPARHSYTETAMGFQTRKRRASDADYKPSPSISKRVKLTEAPADEDMMIEEADPLPPSSAPASPTYWNDDNEPEVDDTPAPFFPQPLPPLPMTPSRRSATSASASGDLLTSPMRPSPEKPYGGRKRVSNPRRNPRGVREMKKGPEWTALELQRNQERAAQVKRDMEMLNEQKQAKERAVKQDIQDQVFDLLGNAMKPAQDGTPGLTTKQIFESLFEENPNDSAKAALITRYFHKHGASLIEKLAKRAPEVVESFMDDWTAAKVREEGQALQQLLTRAPGTKVIDLLSSFNMQGLSADIQRIAPTIWKTLKAAATPSKSTRKEGTRRDQGLVRVNERDLFPI